ncbi:serine carboxypeptidase-like 18 [Pistacia vera]|uniref:serine carboxypeptidase-like 18 n=1 Tax=Pistacia vera TaxID=55513 RepID=UPI001263939F|nr:serine carboxypeptidase-like 18 [Pistacia vera]
MASKYTVRFSFFCFLSVFVFTLFRNADCGSIVRTLPGFPGVLPFKLETGYVSVGNSELFYLFVESQGNPEVDPVLYYIVGGPGCAALNGFLFQTGPLQFDDAYYTGGLPTLHLYPYTWTKSASIIFADVPVGSGYSYSTNASDYSISDLESVNQSHVFIRKWLSEHPQFIPNRFFIATDSYSGILAPIIAQRILDDNEAGEEPSINLVGIISGSPHTDGELEGNDKVPLAHQLGILSKSLYENFPYLLSVVWANDISVQRALCPREYWLSELGISLDEDWRPWYVGGQVAGDQVTLYGMERKAEKLRDV